MNQLYLFRHGIAVPHGVPGIPDDDRPLTPKGEKRVRQVARGLRRLNVGVDRILSSPLPRARRTAQIVAEELELTDSLSLVDELRPDRDAPSIHEWLSTREEERLMLVGHNPNLSDLIGFLIAAGPNTSPFELPKAGVAVLSEAADSAMKLDWLAPPNILRRIRKR